jgi:hypothetical protein
VYPGVIVHWQKNAWMDSERTLQVAREQLKPFLQTEEIEAALLLIDNLSSQHNAEFLKELGEMGFVYRHGPAGLTESWQPVDHHIGVRYHKMVGVRQMLRYHSAEFEEKFKSIDPKPEQVREWMVEDVEAVYRELEAERTAKELEGESSCFRQSFVSTGCLVSATGTEAADYDAAMKPEGVMDAVEDIKKDQAYSVRVFGAGAGADIKTYQQLLVHADRFSGQRSSAWTADLERLHGDQQQLGEDSVLLADRFEVLQASPDPICLGIVAALKVGYRWAGNSYITFLGQGVDAMVELVRGGSDLDLYVDDGQAPAPPPLSEVFPPGKPPVAAKKKRGERAAVAAREAEPGWQLDGQPDAKWKVAKHTFNVYTAAAATIQVKVDVVTRGEWAKPSSDLFASLHCAWSAELKRPIAGLFFDGAAYPPLELTLHNALRYGSQSDTPVPLYTFRCAICPTSDFSNKIDVRRLNVDGRFRNKLIARQEKKLVAVVPVWHALEWSGESAIILRRGRKTAAEEGVVGVEEGGEREPDGGEGEESVAPGAPAAKRRKRTKKAVGAPPPAAAVVAAAAAAAGDAGEGEDGESEHDSSDDREDDEEEGEEVELDAIVQEKYQYSQADLTNLPSEVIRALRQHSDMQLHYVARRRGVAEGETTLRGTPRRRAGAFSFAGQQ